MKFVVLLMVCVGLGRAESVCPWLNAATAAGVLGGAVTTSVKPGVCEFVREYGSNRSTLRIQVNKKPAFTREKCSTPSTPLKGIGNEAEICTVSNAMFGSFRMEFVSGHVRDLMFGVSIGTNDLGMGSVVRERTRNVAEQVAGSLF